MKRRARLIFSGVLWVLAVLFILLIRRVDVAPIGPEGTSVGLSSLNREVSETVGVNMTWYTITEILGYGAIAVAAFFAVLGAVQWIRRGNLKYVDRGILALAGIYILLGILYVFFEKVIINYRPVILPGEEHPEASFPSSHTMLACVIFGSAGILAGRLLRSGAFQTVLQILCGILIFVTVFGRMISGVHWFTDIVGALLFSSALLMLYSAMIMKSRKKKRKTQTS